MLLEIDYRENKIISLLTDEKNLNYNVLNLPIGDFIIRNSDNNIEYIIERKHVLDLASSIIDLRWKEQKIRLLESMNNDYSKIVYIIEGDKSLINNLPSSTINSALINLIFKHKYKVIFTTNYQDTINSIISLFNKIKNNELDPQNISHTILIKKSSKINQNIMINMLSVIPGVSLNIAQKINDVFPTINKLLENLTEDSLSNIQITDKRKIGKALSIKIFNALTK